MMMMNDDDDDGDGQNKYNLSYSCHISYCVCCCNDVVMIRRINSNSSHGNDYVLADTRESQRRRSKRRPYLTRDASNRRSRSCIISSVKLFEFLVAPFAVHN